MKIDNDLYIYLWQNPYQNNCNTYLISGGITLLIDPGHLRFIPQLFSQMEKDGLSVTKGTDVIALTHCHPDHFEGIEAFVEKHVKIAMSREEERYLKENGRFLFDMMEQSIPKYRIDFFL